MSESRPHRGAIHPADPVQAEVLDDVAAATGTEVAVLGRLSGGLDVGAWRVRLAGREPALLKVWLRSNSHQLDEALRMRRIVEQMRRRGYPTPACRGVGVTATQVWHLMDFVDAAPAPVLTASLVDQLMEIVELQDGHASEHRDHWSYAWRLSTGREHGQDLAPDLTRAVAELPGYSPEVSDLVKRLRALCADAPPPPKAPDMVHADLNPDNVVVRDGAVVAIVDIGNAGSGTRATDLTTLRWYTYCESLDGARERLWTRILDLIGWEQAAVLTGTQILTQLEFPIRRRRHDAVAAVVGRGHRTLDELTALR